jgi:hypothetical protein
MKRSEAGNMLLPNTFQHPNIFIDRLMYYLTAEENTVLTFAVRRILGFQENISSRKDNISLSQFVEGIKSTKDGTPLSMGCGLKKSAVTNALNNLEKFKILIPTTDKPDPRKGQEYWLQEDELAIDWDVLEARKQEQLDKARRRTKKARYSVQQNTPKGAVQQKARESVQQKARVLSNSNTKPRETQGNSPSEKAYLDLFKGYFGKFRSEKELKRWEVIYEAAGKDNTEQLAEWAFKKEIHLTNRGGLMDSLETAAKNWHGTKAVLHPADSAPHPEYQPVRAEDDPNRGKYVPRPAHIPRPAIKSAPAASD